MIFEKTLYAKAQSGVLFFWSIRSHYDLIKHQGIIEIKYGQVGGVVTDQIISVNEGLAGRTIEEQTMLRANSRIEKKLNSGYLESKEDAMNFKRVNAMGLKKQMLAQRYDKLKTKIDFSRGVWVQPKFNGHRCSIFNNGGQLIAYSRNGKLIESIDHILMEIEIPMGMTIDGELYCHGLSLQKISSLVKKNQEESKQLKFMLYDVFDSRKFSERLDIIIGFDFLLKSKHCKLAKTKLVMREYELNAAFAKFVSDGYEGAMVRLDGSPYEDGKRSKSLLKMKKKFDDEFLVVDIIASSEGWAILQCVAKNGKRFSVSAPGSMYEKYNVYENKKEYIGKFIQIEYYDVTDDGIPFHPVALMFREKNAE